MSVRERPVPFTMSGVRRGLRRARPLAVGVFAYGVAFGLLAREAGLSALEALAMSGLVYSGSAQLAAVGALREQGLGVGPAALAATILVLNARYLLYGAALHPWLGAVAPGQAYGALFVLGDGNWLLSMKAHADGERDGGFVLGSGLAMFAAWLAGTLAGAGAGALLPDPASLGLDLLLVAFAAAMAADMVRSRTDLATVALAAAVALAVTELAGGGWAVVAAGLAAAALAALREPGA